MTSIYSEKDILSDALTSVKMATRSYNNYSNECVHKDLRNSLLKLLSEEHEIQDDIFEIMHERGYYPTPDAELKKIQETQSKFSKAL